MLTGTSPGGWRLVLLLLLGAAAAAQWLPDDVHLVEARLEVAHEWADLTRSAGTHQRPSRTSAALVVGDTLAWFGGAVVCMPVVRLDVATGQPAVVVPRLGLTIGGDGPVLVRANVGRAYRLPTFEELYFDAGAVRGNPDLAPEDALVADASIELRGGPGALRLGWFHLEIDNLIVFLPRSAFVYEASGTKAARSQGVEIEARWRPMSALDARLAYTFTDARFRDTGLRLPARSPHRLDVALTWRGRRHAATVAVHWQAPMPLDRFEQIVAPGRTFVDTTVRVWPTRWLELRLDLRNLTDVRDAVDALQRPLPGLTVLATARIHVPSPPGTPTEDKEESRP